MKDDGNRKMNDDGNGIIKDDVDGIMNQEFERKVTSRPVIEERIQKTCLVAPTDHPNMSI
jgi:hypothetical protein